VGGGRAFRRKVDEYRFAVAQLGCQLLSILGFDLAGINHAERIPEIAV
jgi:hypothetical protein